jgi:hypothetical protein
MSRKAVLIFCLVLVVQVAAVLGAAVLVRPSAQAGYAPSVNEILEEQHEALERLRRARGH